jgi:hypothetical protein
MTTAQKVPFDEPTKAEHDRAGNHKGLLVCLNQLCRVMFKSSRWQKRHPTQSSLKKANAGVHATFKQHPMSTLRE